MDTFLIFLFVFGIFGWCLWKLLAYTKNTIGENSPLKTRRIYQINEWQYFTKFHNLINYYVLFIGFVCLKGIFTLKIAPNDDDPRLTYIILIFLTLFIFGISAFCLVLEMNHWRYTNGVVLTTNPEQHELELSFSGASVAIKEGDLEKIVITSNETKMRFCYFTYYLKNGDHFILSDRMPGLWVIQEYFKKVPVEYRSHWFPYIS